MPKAPAQDKAHKEKRAVTGLRCLGGILLSVMLAGLVLSLFAENAEARSAGWATKRKYTLSLSVNYTYESRWGDVVEKRSSFAQNYMFRHTGYIVDPRLVNYIAGVRVTDRMTLEGNGGGDYTATGFNARVTLFEGIDRNRGLSMWKYVPSPLMFYYNIDFLSGGVTSQSYGMNMYYTRPGTLRVFSNKKIIFYDDGTNNTNLRRNLNGNRYRYKYNNSNYNVNGNGNTNSNWNRNRNQNNNGNSNWNRNGYMNRNRNVNGNVNTNRNRNVNGNVNLNLNSNIDSNSNADSYGEGKANWNRNGEANWNRNGNSNWNRNGNSNWNRNWNRNFNYNRNYNRRVPGMGLFSFAYPSFSLDVSRSTVSGGLRDGYYSNQANVRINITNKPRRLGRKQVYKSSYMVSYRYRDESIRDTYHRLALSDTHRWRHINWSNTFSYMQSGNQETYTADTDVTYMNEFQIKGQPFPYNIDGGASYSRTGSASSWSASATAGTSTAKSKRLMPGLVSSSRVNTHFTRKQNKAGYNDNIYSVGLSERVVSTQFKKTRLTGTFSTSYSESGIPIRLTASALYKHSARFTVNGGYSFSTRFIKEHLGSTMNHHIWISANYVITQNLKYTGRITHTLNMTRDGISDSYNKTKIHNTLSWRINSRSKLSMVADYSFSDTKNSSVTLLSVEYTNRIQRAGNIHLYGQWMKRGSNPAEKLLETAYSFSVRKFKFNASYRIKISGNGNTEHRLLLKVSRTFGRTLRRLW